jgi:predicted Zn-dependent protease
MNASRRAVRCGLVATAVLAWLQPAHLGNAVQRLSFKPGFNLFSPAQDVQVGKENAAQVDKQMPILRDPQLDRYIHDLGRRLASFAPNNRSEYVWQFKVVNSRDINAFALPGGYVYVNRATIEAAANEAQLAGVMAHESGHVVMRHGTHQASQAILARAPLAIVSGILGQSSSAVSQIAQLGGGLGLNLLLLRNSRAMESQADQVGTYILYQAGYDPHAMAQFFETVEKKYPSQAPQFLSDHPNPGNRIKAVDAEIPELGPTKNWKTDSPEFQAIKQRVLAMPPAPQPRPQSQPGRQ